MTTNPKTIEDYKKQMVNRFLGWKLPEDFQPDAGISYKKPENPHPRPVGTNLFTATQAEEMLDYVLSDLSTIVRDIIPNKLKLKNSPYFKSSTSYGYLKGYNQAREDFIKGLKEYGLELNNKGGE